MGEGAHVAVEEGELVLALVEPDEVAARVHQADCELLEPSALPIWFDRGREEVDKTTA